MKKYNIDNFKGGWFIGDFNPSLIKTKDFEIAIKYYKSGDEDDEHVHLLADEYTVIVKGQVIMNGEIFEEKDIRIFMFIADEKLGCIINFDHIYQIKKFKDTSIRLYDKDFNALYKKEYQSEIDRDIIFDDLLVDLSERASSGVLMLRVPS